MLPTAYITLGLALAFFVINLASWLARRSQLEGLHRQRRALLSEVSRMKREAAQLNTPSTYAKCAKLQRAAAAKEKELQQLSTSQEVQSSRHQYSVTLQVLLGASAVALCWQQPAAILPRRWLWPFNSFMAMPHGKHFAELGWVAMGPFCYMCSRASRAAAQAMLPVRQLPTDL